MLRSPPACAVKAPPTLLREPEVTRTVSLGAPDGAQRPTSVTPFSDQHVTWSGPLENLFGCTADAVDSTEDWWLSRIHPGDVSVVVESLRQHLLPKPNPYASDSRIWGYDYRFRHADGHYILTSDRTITERGERGNALMFTSVLFDKEDRHLKRREHRRKLDSQNHLATIAENTPSGIFVMDPQGYCTFMNAAAEQITGFRLDEISDYTFHASVHSCRRNGEPYPIHECPIFCHQQRGTTAKNESEIFVHKDGHHYDIVYSVSAVGDYASGGSVIEFRDVTEEKRLDQERMNAILVNEQQSVRIKESEAHKANLDSFVSFVCHELRNPLQGVTSSAEFLSDTLEKLEALTGTLAATYSVTLQGSEISTDTIQKSVNNSIDGHTPYGLVEKQGATLVETPTVTAMQSLITYAKELVSNIATCASHQALITNDVLDLSRLDAGKVEPSCGVVDIQALGREVVAMMTARAQVKSINLSIANEKRPLLYLKADKTILSQVLLNLVGNAIKFTPENGTITVDLYADPPNASGKIILHGSVTDNGLGMTEADQLRLFQRFSQANRKVAQLYGGSGLGLSISKELVKTMGGEMHVKSVHGEGSTFSFTSAHDPATEQECLDFLKDSPSPADRLPAANAPEATTAPPMVNGEPAAAPPFRMLCVAEDNPINLKHLSKHLTTLHYAHVLCANGQEAVDRFCAHDSAIDAVIIDMSMPVMDGLEATRLMRLFEERRRRNGEQRPTTPIIALSGNAMKEQIDDAMAAGMSDYLVKPCKQADLASTLTHWERVVHSGAPHKPVRAPS
ncbi:hypothetical protein B0A49_10005 [Cryomyces minteri]|uniref:histidine kinase n=1 Tax=Cryomyces minteri TaxID=331657 RepID=A0A4U0WWZ7_9PEZI|nr:hypothetical protein B0A49_10005 [Cryomyces minteri]